MRETGACLVSPQVVSIAIFSAVFFLGGVSAFGRGAPRSTCLTRYPSHGGAGTQTTQSPYVINVNMTTYSPGEVVQVTIQSPDNRKFVGFELAAFRSDNPLEIVGRFTNIPEGTAKFITCPGGYKNLITHTSNAALTSLMVEWEAPSYNAGDLQFKATVLQNFKVFWTDVEATINTANSSAVQQPVYKNVRTREIMSDVNFSDCDDSLSCFLYPRHCDVNKCIAGVSFQYRPDTDDYLVQMYADSTSNPGYVSVAFSDDDRMGGDETFICAATTQEMSVQYGFNPAQYNQRLITEYISDAQVKMADGRIQCRFVMASNTTVTRVDHQATTDSSGTVYTRQSFNKDRTWHVQLAWGPVLPDSNVAMRHDDLPVTTASKILIKDPALYRGSVFPAMVKVHGVVMIFAWTFLSGIVTVIARHYKDMMSSRRLLGTKVWFQVHRGLALVVAILTVIGLAVVFGHYGSSIRDLAVPHAYVGLAVTAALGLQVIVGMLRPGPDHKLRVVFNWGHRLLGQALHILAAVTMFLAFDIEYILKDQRKFGFIALAIWVGVKFLWKVFFEIVGCLLKPKPGDSYKKNESEGDAGKTSCIPAVLLFIYIMFLAGCCAAVLAAFLSY